MAQAPAPLPRLHPNLAEIYRRKVAELEFALRDPALQDEALQILRGLIERVEVIPTETDSTSMSPARSPAWCSFLPELGERTTGRFGFR